MRRTSIQHVMGFQQQPSQLHSTNLRKAMSIGNINSIWGRDTCINQCRIAWPSIFKTQESRCSDKTTLKPQHGLLKAQTQWALAQLKALEHSIKTQGSFLIQNTQVPESLTVMNSRIIKQYIPPDWNLECPFGKRRGENDHG